jgi:hypothetical protein
LLLSCHSWKEFIANHSQLHLPPVM